MYLLYSLLPLLCSKALPVPDPTSAFQAPARFIKLSKVALISNPNSGTANADLMKEVTSLWESQGIEVQQLSTEHAGHGEEILRTINTDGLDAIIISGGDGSMHDVSAHQQ